MDAVHNQLTIHAYAKINLTLDILGKRPDGYHDLEMVMQSVSLYDEVTVKLKDAQGIIVKSPLALQIDEKNNTAYKAASRFFEYCGMAGKGAEIEIQKNIPMEAGLAGGSADAAAVIFALDKLCKTGLTDEKLWEIGVKVGADVPFCITGGTMLAQGKGEILSRLPQLSAFSAPPMILLCKPDVGVSTGRAYAAVDNASADALDRPSASAMKEMLFVQDVAGLAAHLGNVFEQVLRVEECEKIKRIMMDGGALGACMTGSGSTVFGIFSDEELANQTCKQCLCSYKNTFLTQAVGHGCEIISSDQ